MNKELKKKLELTDEEVCKKYCPYSNVEGYCTNKLDRYNCIIVQNFRGFETNVVIISPYQRWSKK
jgi:hypothetical protein